ncbi:MAG: cytochrome c biogenesis protein CcsA, partial [Micromonosporaceae bacterium]
MASLSDQLLTVAVLCYAIAMLAHAVEYAFGAQSAVGRAVRRDERELVKVGSSGAGAVSEANGAGPVAVGGADSADDADHDSDTEPSRPGISPRHAALAGKLGFGLTVLGAVAQAGCLVARGMAANRVPWGNMYEFVIAVCLVGVAAWIAVAYRRPVRHLGLFVTLVVVLLLGFAAVRLYTDAGPLVPALNSYWLKIHVTTAILATGLFMVG